MSLMSTNNNVNKQLGKRNIAIATRKSEPCLLESITEDTEKHIQMGSLYTRGKLCFTTS